MDNVDIKIINQLEYYFGNFNLPRDTFLQELIKEDDGWVPLTTMLKFNRLSAICSDVEKIGKAVANSGSNIITIFEDKIRRNPENPPSEDSVQSRQEAKNRSVYMKGFKPETLLDEIISWANQFGETESVFMRRVRTDDHTFDGSVYITYKTQEEAEVARKSVTMFNEQELVKMTVKDYWTQIDKERKEVRAAEKAAKVAKKKAEMAQQKHNYEKGLILMVSGLGEDATFDNIKIFFEQFGPVSHVTLKDESANVRFIGDENGGALNAWKKAVDTGIDGKVIFQNSELIGRVLDGEEEEKYWIQYSNHIKSNLKKLQEKKKKGRKNRDRKRRRRGGRKVNKQSKRNAEDIGEDEEIKKAKHTVFNDDDE